MAVTSKNKKGRPTVAKTSGGGGVPASLSSPEPHPMLARLRQSLAKKYSPTRMQVLFEVVYLGWYLAALGRAYEASTLMGEVADPVAFDGNFNLWTPIADALILSARVSPEPARKAKLARVLEHPAVAEGTRSDLNLSLASARQKIADARGYPAQKIACELFAQGISRLAYFEQTAGHGCHYDAWVDRQKLGQQIDGALAELKQRLSES